MAIMQVNCQCESKVQGWCGPVSEDAPGSWTNQRWRTRTAILDAARAQALTGAEISMAAVAKSALVSEATAYRYFPDLVSLLREVLADTWPEPAAAMAPIAASTDAVERVGFATQFMLHQVLARQGAVRAMISASVQHPEVAGQARPGHRFGLIDYALAPLGQPPSAAATDIVTDLKLGLAIIVSAEALFVLTDLCALTPEEAVASVTRTARALTQAAVKVLDV